MRYEIVYLDLDHTLLDFEFAEENALKLLFREKNRVLTDEECALYSSISRKWWSLLDSGGCTKEEVIVERFREYFDELSVKEDPVAASERYLEHLANQGLAIDGALEFLQEVKKLGQRMAAITNGVEFVQHRRIEVSGLDRFLDFVVTSEQAESTKPDPGIFHYAVKLSGISIEKSVYVGDSPETDWAGARNAGMDFILIDLFNRTAQLEDLQIARSYKQLLTLLQ